MTTLLVEAPLETPSDPFTEVSLDVQRLQAMIDEAKEGRWIRNTQDNKMGKHCALGMIAFVCRTR